MIKALDHIALILSSEHCLDFYKALGFKETSRTQRPDHHDQLIWLEGFGTTLEVFLDNTHPQRLSNPESNGLRHIAFTVDNLEQTHKDLAQYNPEPIRQTYRIFFVKDPDGQPIEFRENKSR